MIILIESFFIFFCKMAYNCAGLALWSQVAWVCAPVCVLPGCSLTPASNMASFSPLEAGPKVSDSEGRAQN